MQFYTVTDDWKVELLDEDGIEPGLPVFTEMKKAYEYCISELLDRVQRLVVELSEKEGS